MNVFKDSLSEVLRKDTDPSNKWEGGVLEIKGLKLLPCLEELTKMMPAGGVSHEKTPADKAL